MPTAIDYRSAASTLRATLEDVVVYRCALAAWPVADHFGGPIAASVTAAIDAIVEQAQASMADLLTLAELCEFRAGVCEDYERAVYRWHVEVNGGAHDLEYPAPPYRWVEE